MSGISVSNGVHSIKIGPAPAIDQYNIRSSGTVMGPFTNDGSGVLSGLTYRITNSGSAKFFQAAGTPMSSNSLLNANLLNRIAYGPTPDELTRLASIGPEAYINEQLAPEALNDTFDDLTIEAVNTGTTAPVPGWQKVTYTGTLSTTNLYLYLTRVGDAFIDDVEVRLMLPVISTNNPGTTNETYVTNLVAGTNLVLNGDFELGTLSPSWLVAPNMTNSSLDTTVFHSGSKSLHMVATAPGNTQSNSISSPFFSPTNATSTRVQLSYWYLAATNSSIVQARLSGSGVVGTAYDAPQTPEWIYVTATGAATSTRSLYIYLNAAGTAYVDDLKLVAGSVPEVGVNLLPEGTFESPLVVPWFTTADFTNSVVSTDYAHSGASSLKVVATAGGGGSGDSITRTNIVNLTNNGIYTVSFWYLPSPGDQLTVRLSGSLLNATPDATGTPGQVLRKLERIGTADAFTGTANWQAYASAGLGDLRAWFTSSAVSSKRQLLQVLLQFLDNHFVTQNSKSRDYTDGRYDNGTLEDAITTEWDYREIKRWTAALLNPNCTFYDLLKVSVESPAMIIYLDTVNSKGSGNQIANENYARELLELFTMGVDNGYDQNDIIVMSRVWTGWTVDIVDPWNIDNPFAVRTVRNGLYEGVGTTGTSNLVGVWSFIYTGGNHGTNRTPIFSTWNPSAPATNPIANGPKLIPARFGAAFGAGSSYQFSIPPGRTGTNGIRDGYDAIAHLSNLPFTMEYLSVKLCRLFIHDDFVHGVYDYTDPNRSAEAELIRQCMTAWNTPAGDGRKGNIRSVLTTIFNSDLFRSHGGSLQKVKTPYEFVISTVRAMRAAGANGAYTANTDGYSFASPMSRMGGMSLFNRAEPDGWPEAGPPWISAGTLDERVRFVQAVLRAGTGDDGGNCTADPVALLKAKLPSNQWNVSSNVVDYFLGIIYPGEGRANLAEYRSLAINYLETTDNGAGTSSPFNALGNTTPEYDTRVRAMVAMLMSMPRFQEQ